jgi:hypothetical protein
VPRRDRRLRKEAVNQANAELDSLLAQVPRHAMHRVNRPSALGLALRTDGTAYNWGGAKYDSLGQLRKPQIPDEQGANYERSDHRRMDASVLRLRYPHDWGVRAKAKKIAAETSLSVRTVQKYFRDYP